MFIAKDIILGEAWGSEYRLVHLEDVRTLTVAQQWLNESGANRKRVISVWSLQEKEFKGSSFERYLNTSHGVLLVHDDSDKNRYLIFKSSIYRPYGAYSLILYQDLRVPDEQKIREVVYNALNREILHHYQGVLPLRERDTSPIGFQLPLLPLEPICPLAKT